MAMHGAKRRRSRLGPQSIAVGDGSVAYGKTRDTHTHEVPTLAQQPRSKDLERKKAITRNLCWNNRVISLLGAQPERLLLGVSHEICGGDKADQHEARAIS